ncbi:MAG: transglutaminase-like domain-containing protein [Planctomycetes bacterium]|nr:transglutaminase-like domain-containing protein [Planctomycetota bacterium]
MILDVLLALLWGLGGLIGALPDARFGWVAGPLMAAAWGIGAGFLKFRQLVIPRHPGGYALLAATWAAAAGLGLAMNPPREAVLPACAAAVAALFLLERRSALQGHAIVTASFIAAVMGATRDNPAKMLPLFVPYLVVLVLSLALVHQQWVLQRLRRAVHEGYMLAAQVPGYGGTRTGLAPTIALVATTTTLAAALLYLAVPHIRWKAPDDRNGGDATSGRGTSGLPDRLSLHAMHDLKMDFRIALKVKLIQDGRTVRPTLPMRLRGAVVDSTNNFEWWSTLGSATRRDASDGVADGWVTFRPRAAQPVLQECEVESAGDRALLALQEVAQVEAASVSIDAHGVVRLIDMPAEGRYRYQVVSDVTGTDPAEFEAAPRSPFPCYLQLAQVDPEIEALAKAITAGGDTAARKAALIESWLQANFEYSTEFDPSGESDPVRALLFVEKRGYCVHFAATMAVMLRHLGIPCRVAQGLYGGEWSDGEMRTFFKFSDAHAWVEVWMGSMAGWATFDPTPHAHQGGGGEDPSEFMGGTPDNPISTPRPPDAGRPSSTFSTEPLTALSLERQARWLRNLRGLIVDAWHSRLGKAVVFLAVFLFSLLVTWRLLPHHERNRLRAVFGSSAASAGFWDEFIVLASRAGFRRAHGETPFEFGKRVEHAYPGASRVALALYAVRFGGRDAAAKSAEARPILDGIRKTQAGKAKEAAQDAPGA